MAVKEHGDKMLLLEPDQQLDRVQEQSQRLAVAGDSAIGRQMADDAVNRGKGGATQVDVRRQLAETGQIQHSAAAGGIGEIGHIGEHGDEISPFLGGEADHHLSSRAIGCPYCQVVPSGGMAQNDESAISVAMRPAAGVQSGMLPWLPRCGGTAAIARARACRVLAGSTISSTTPSSIA